MGRESGWVAGVRGRSKGPQLWLPPSARVALAGARRLPRDTGRSANCRPRRKTKLTLSGEQHCPQRRTGLERREREKIRKDTTPDTHVQQTKFGRGGFQDGNEKRSAEIRETVRVTFPWAPVHSETRGSAPSPGTVPATAGGLATCVSSEARAAGNGGSRKSTADKNRDYPFTADQIKPPHTQVSKNTPCLFTASMSRMAARV